MSIYRYVYTSRYMWEDKSMIPWTQEEDKGSRRLNFVGLLPSYGSIISSDCVGFIIATL